MTDHMERANQILDKPYSRTLTKQPDGEWVAEIREIPGCHASGQTQAEALASLEEHARELVALYLRKEQPVPPPLATEFSGHFALRMPKGLHQRAAQMAAWEGTSLNQFVVSAIAERIGYADRPRMSLAASITVVAGATMTSGIGFLPGSIHIPSSTDRAFLSELPRDFKFAILERDNG